MARRTKEDAEKTREALLDAAERVFLQRGVATATLNEIAKEAGLTRGAVYWHFEDKIAIFRAMYDRVKQPIDALFEQMITTGNPVEGLRAIGIRILQDVGRDAHTRNVFTIIRLRSDDLQCNDLGFAHELRCKRDQALEKFERVFAQALLVSGLTPHTAAIALHAYFTGILHDYLRDPESMDIITLAPVLMETFYRGLLREE